MRFGRLSHFYLIKKYNFIHITILSTIQFFFKTMHDTYELDNTQTN